LLLPLVTGAVEARRGVREWTHQIGVEALHAIFDDDAKQIVGAKRKQQRVRMYNHWGSTPTVLEFGGRRISVERSRGRRRGDVEVDLPTVKDLQSFDPLSETVLNQILLGVSQ
jgi:hypothetical protein